MDCSKRDANLDMAITAYKRGLFRLSDKKEVFNSLKYPSMSDGFTNGYGTYVEGGNEITTTIFFKNSNAIRKNIKRKTKWVNQIITAPGSWSCSLEEQAK